MKILMVCLGNICRSPIAQGILESKIARLGLPWQVDSAGTSGWHDGEGPDLRAVELCKTRGLDISRQVSRKLTAKDLDHYDLILAMDSSNYQEITAICHTQTQHNKVRLILNYLYPHKNMAVPDPYYNGRFGEVYDLLDEAIDSLVDSLSAAKI